MPRFFIITFLVTLICGCGTIHDKRFQKVAANDSKIFFNNTILENDSINPIKLEFLYNGGGVAIADFNNDSLPDIYFTASTTSNKLYINRSKLRFEDVTNEAGVTGEGRWCNGVSIVDINNDGWQDIYVCTSILKDPEKRRNLLYINQKSNSNGVPAFKEMAAEFGLADTSWSVQASFFDYDRDGDLDVYLTTTKTTTRTTYTFGNRRDSTRSDYDKLFQNNWSETLQHPVFTDVSIESGINEGGYGLGVTVGDINNDGWPDVYVTNDFITSDHLYINNRNGTFSNKVKETFRHTSQNAMGNDISDINNDGWLDIVAVDMNPEHNQRKQKNMGAANYGKYRNMFDYGYSLQFVRNTLQINRGLFIQSNDSLQLATFSDISYYSGTAETDWSWTPSLADFDNDGMRDLLITNGYPKDVTDHDYVSFRRDKGFIVSDNELLKQIPEIKVANYAFRNTPDLVFEDVSESWGLNDKAYSTGAAYADLDDDGDLDYVINNINEEASVYENTTDPKINPGNNFIRLKFRGDSKNTGGVGTRATIYVDSIVRVYENFPVRGYLSSVESAAHFGLANATLVDSIIVLWQDSKKQVIRKVTANQTITVDIRNAENVKDSLNIKVQNVPAFSSINNETGIDFKHTEYDFIDFDYQRLLPHKLSQYGPALAVADIDGNGLDDIFASGSKGKPGMFFLQQQNGRFVEKPLQHFNEPFQKPFEELGTLFFDVDNDSDVDLYICSGSNEFQKIDSAYRDRLFINDGRGNFREVSNALPANLSSKQVLKSIDFDTDGDLDLFIGSRSVPNEYPKKTSGFLYRNDTRGKHLKFTDVTATLAPALKDLGMIADAVWSDFNNDAMTDLVICGEFMSLHFFQNTGSSFKQIETGVDSLVGAWNSITPADVNNDGMIDYVAGNAGLNTFYKGTKEHPFEIYADDFDNNGSFDAIPFLYLKNDNGERKQYPAFMRDDMIKQMIRIKGRFKTYTEFADATATDILTADEIKKAERVSANYMYSTVFINKGNGKFISSPLPYQAQWSPVFSVLPDDFDSDGFIDLLVNMNDLGTEVNTGQYDASNGLYLKGDGKGNFSATPYHSSGYYIPSNGKAAVKFLYNNQYATAISQNNAPLLVFKMNRPARSIRLNIDDIAVDIFLKNGSVRREEGYYGNSFLSQSSRFIMINNQAKKANIINNKGITREVNF